ncbi:polysaccharide biosynthesis/export family protein [Bacterioplanoides sp.]|uniref:polysaccharide biosynthesis/export family protein n=1 Tax=Bacterioplanoides sp. TaxID=2066072 RepID=UPI003B5CFB02
MFRFISCLLLVCLPFFSSAEINRYRLGAGDLINISVYDEKDLTLEVRIGLSGQISYPLLGDVVVSGLSPKELEQKLTAGLKGPYLIDPSVTVSIIEYRPFYVTGEVKKPGSYAFHPGLTVDRAISIAGGFTERASKGSIYVKHDERKQSSELNQSDAEDKDAEQEEKESVEIYDVVQPGDVITVEQSFF